MIKILFVCHKDIETGTHHSGRCLSFLHYIGRFWANYFFSAAAFSCRAFSIRSGVMGISVKRQPVAL